MYIYYSGSLLKFWAHVPPARRPRFRRLCYYKIFSSSKQGPRSSALQTIIYVLYIIYLLLNSKNIYFIEIDPKSNLIKVCQNRDRNTTKKKYFGEEKQIGSDIIILE